MKEYLFIFSTFNVWAYSFLTTDIIVNYITNKYGEYYKFHVQDVISVPEQDIDLFNKVDILPDMDIIREEMAKLAPDNDYSAGLEANLGETITNY
jgi:hypothetical protein